MAKHAFLTDLIFNDQHKTLKVLNRLLDERKNLVADHDFHSNSNPIFLEVYDTKEARKILTPLISDFEAYIEFNNKHYASDEETEIGLLALLDIYYNHYLNKGGQLRWAKRSRRLEFIDPPGSQYRIISNEQLAAMEADAIKKGIYQPPTSVKEVGNG